MAVDLSDHPDAGEPAQGTLSEFRETQNEFEEFFGGVFDDLQSLSLELFARHKCLEVTARQQAEGEGAQTAYQQQVLQCLEDLRQVQAEIRAGHEETHRAFQEICAAQKQSQEQRVELHEMQEEFRRVGQELHALQENADRERAELHQLYASAEDHLKRLAAVSSELAETQSRSAQEPQIAQLLETTRQQQTAWQQERAALESELETARRLAAQQSESLAEYKRVASQHQAELTGELKRMRGLLETLASQMRGPAPGSPAKDGSVSSSPESAVLGSVLAQFEMIQRDVTQRRASKEKRVEKS